MNIDKFEVCIIILIAFGCGMLGGMFTQELRTRADLIELDEWRTADSYQQMWESRHQLPRWCQMIEDGNYGYNWDETK